MGKNKVPKVDELMDPSIQVLKSLGGSASIEELVPEIVRLLGLSQEVADVPHGTTSRTELEYREPYRDLRRLDSLNQATLACS